MRHAQDKEKTHVQWSHCADVWHRERQIRDAWKMLPSSSTLQLESRRAGAPARGASGLQGSGPGDHPPSPSLGQAGPVLLPLAQHLHSKGRNRERIPSFPGPGWVPHRAVPFPATASSRQEGPSTSQCSHGMSSSRDLKEILSFHWLLSRLPPHLL